MSEVRPNSPCVDVCVLRADGYCSGCYRTIEEIAGWRTMTEDEREIVWRELRLRAATRALREID